MLQISPALLLQIGQLAATTSVRGTVTEWSTKRKYNDGTDWSLVNVENCRCLKLDNMTPNFNSLMMNND